MIIRTKEFLDHNQMICIKTIEKQIKKNLKNYS